ncbi:ribonuclease H-like domain-containing protein [Tanacetum coccineum]
MPTVGSSPVAATRQPTSPSPQPTSTSAHSTGPLTNQPTNHSTLQPTPSAPTNPTPTTNLPPTNSIPPTPPPVPSPATIQPNRNLALTHSMVTRYHVGTNRPTQRYTLYVSTISPISKSYNHAFQDPHWYRVMLDEYNALIKNNTWILVPRPSNANIVRSLWLFRHKYNANGTLNRYKARLVANGSTQLIGIDIDETFSSVVKSATIHTVLSLALSRHWHVHQLDVKNAFLHSSLSETVYMQQPLGFRDSQHPDHSIISTLHVEFSMTDLGPLNYFLGISVTRNTSGMFLSQQKYASELLERAGMLTCNPCRTPVDMDSKLSIDGDHVSDPTLYRSLAGALQYLTFTRPDISYAVQQVCLYMHDPREPHFSALKRILRYIRGTMPYGLQLFSSTTSSLVAYSDADWAGCPTTRRSTSGYCVFLGNNLLSWSSKRQVTLSRSSAEAEYRGVANAVAETCWLRNLLRELHTPLSTATLVYCDNVSAVYLSSNPVQHQRTKHIEIDIHFVRDLVAAGHIRVLHVPSRYQYADVFTKGLPTVLFDEFRSSLSVRSSPTQTARGSTETTTTTSVTNAQLKALIEQGIADALAARDADKSMNGDDSHNSGTGVRRTERVARECTYQDFMNCKPLFFKGTEGVVELTQWFERMETVFRISNCSVENQIKFATCTLLGIALTWWNSHVRTVSHDVAYAMTWTALKKKMTDKYCPRGEIKKLEAELWNLKVKGTDVLGYNQRFQELALLCVRMFPEESDKIERYVGGLPDMIHGSVVASKPKTMQDAIEMATELMDKKISTLAERQAENKRKLDNNNQAQQPPKRQDVAQAYAAGTGERKEYAGTLPLCNKCKFHHHGPCTAKSDCPKLKNQNHGNQAGGTGTRGVVHALGGGETNQDLNNIEDEIEA